MVQVYSNHNTLSRPGTNSYKWSTNLKLQTKSKSLNKNHWSLKKIKLNKNISTGQLLNKIHFRWRLVNFLTLNLKMKWKWGSVHLKKPWKHRQFDGLKSQFSNQFAWCVVSSGCLGSTGHCSRTPSLSGWREWTRTTTGRTSRSPPPRWSTTSSCGATKSCVTRRCGCTSTSWAITSSPTYPVEIQTCNMRPSSSDTTLI